MRRNRTVLVITDEQRIELSKWAQSRTLPAGDVFRARLILALADGPATQSCDLTNDGADDCALEAALRRARDRGPGPAPQRQPTARGQCGRAGAHRSKDATEAIRRLHALVLPEDGEGTEAEQIDGAAGVGASALEAAPAGSLHGFEDPRFEEKAADIIGLYMNPPQHAAGSASTRRRRSKRWTASIRCCLCRPAAPSGTALNTIAMARCRYTQPWT